MLEELSRGVWGAQAQRAKTPKTERENANALLISVLKHLDGNHDAFGELIGSGPIRHNRSEGRPTIEFGGSNVEDFKHKPRIAHDKDVFRNFRIIEDVVVVVNETVEFILGGIGIADTAKFFFVSVNQNGVVIAIPASQGN